MTTRSPTCPVCGQGSAPSYTNGVYHMYRCRNCRTAFVDPMPPQSELDAYYDRFHSGAGVYGEFEARMDADFPAKAEIAKQHLPTEGRLLDVGCGRGFFVRMCRDRRIDASGIDLSTSGVEYATQTLGVPAVAGLIEDLAPTLGKFHVVTFWATIEHLPDPLATLRAIRSVMEPGGILLCDTGIGDDWLDRLLPGYVQWYDPPLHLFVFSSAGLQGAVEQSGFSVIRHNPIFERSRARRFARIVRAAVAASGLRAVAEATRLSMRGEFTRHPIGNLQMVVAKAV